MAKKIKIKNLFATPEDLKKLGINFGVVEENINNKFKNKTEKSEIKKDQKTPEN